jgi:hypothetical protein
MNVAMNKQGYESFETVLNNGMRAINVKDLETVAEDWNFNLRYQKQRGLCKGIYSQSINIGINGDFAPGRRADCRCKTAHHSCYRNRSGRICY